MVRDAGIAVRINRTPGLNRSVIVTGKIQDFLALFTREMGQDPSGQGVGTHLQKIA
ncbi:MAG: hypothetical protein KAW93_09225 [Methanogenium sp.]|nr:hypothetical protein [Methanogenium sp.]